MHPDFVKDTYYKEEDEEVKDDNDTLEVKQSFKTVEDFESHLQEINEELLRLKDEGLDEEYKKLHSDL